MTRFLRLALAAPLGLAIGATTHATAHADDELPPLSIYGFARLDVLVDDSRMSDVAQPMFVMLEGTHGKTDAELAMTPRLSRIGLGIDTWRIASGVYGEGELEVDFAGGSGTNAIRLRKAYASINLQNLVELVAGQTNDLISPLFPSAQNDTQLLFAGNTGDRRPQLQLAVTPGTHLRVALGVSSTGWVSHADVDHDGSVDGMTSPRPMLQWLVEYRQRFRDDVMRLGLWGHAATTQLADGSQSSGASIGMHLYLPLARKLVALGEGYVGSGLGDIGGSIDQSYNLVMQRTVHGAGGWLELAALPTEHHMLAVGASLDTARSSDLQPGDRERNGTIYGVVRYKPLASLQLGLEYLYWQTRYKDVGQGIANRVDLHLSVLF